MSASSDRNLYSVLESRFPPDPDAPCMILADGSVVTYGSLRKESARYANLLVSLGVRPGDRVAVQARKTPRAVFLYLGCLRAGAVYLPMNDDYRSREVEYFLGDARPRVFVRRPQAHEPAGEPAGEPAAEAGVAHVFELDDEGRGSLAEAASACSDAFATLQRSGDDLAAILYTSGTTGRSKGAMLSHRNLASNALTLHEYWKFRPGDVLLHMLPIFHVHGLFVAAHTILLNGGAMLFEPKFDAGRAVELMPRATVFMGVPTYYARLLAEPGLTRDLCARMRLFISGSAPLPAETFNAFRERTGHAILERYGMTEGGMFTSNPVDGERRAGTVGFPLPGVSLRIADDRDLPAGDGDIGVIQVKGDNVFCGYWRMPEKTKEEFTADGFFKTGDMGKRDADGYISIVGRSRDLIITGGLNVYPKEIEDVIDAVPGVAESAVIGLPHADFGEAVTAVVVRRPDEAGAALSEAAIIGVLKRTLAGFKVPKRIIFVDDLPRNTMGKVRKEALRRRHA